MARRRTKKKGASRKSTASRAPRVRPGVGGAEAHGQLVNEFVHVFVDDQNLFWGIVNDEIGPGFRIDFGRLLIAACRDAKGKARGVASAYIAGVIPDDDSFWRVAENQGFKVRRGYLGTNSRSKQDDAYLITDMVSTLFEQEGPSTIVLVAGDSDYGPPLRKSLERGWRNEVAFTMRGLSTALVPLVHEFRTVSPGDINYGDLY